MRVYETIISILEKKGPLPIPVICNEVNRVLITHQEKPYKPSQIKSIVTRKQDLFYIQGGKISIHPDKHPFSLIAAFDCYGGTSYQVRIHFLKKRFTFLEWRNQENIQPFSDFKSKTPGNIEEFKRQIYSMKLWEWEPSYQKNEGISLEGNYWTVKLYTKGKLYKSEGTEYFPPNWDKFSKAIEKLTGVPFR